jgi:DNA repair protein RadC
MSRTDDKPHYAGHRDRLRERFLVAGEKSLADYELLELLLFLSRTRGDVKPMAKALISRFGSFAEVISATPSELMSMPGIGESFVIALKTAQAAAIRLIAQPIMNRPINSSWRQLLDYCHASMAFNKIEQFRVLYLDKKNILIADEVQQEGTVDHTPVYPREILKRALELAASAFIMVHNHPSGDTTPSQEDIEMTREVARASEPLGIILHDHVVVGRSGHTSFKSLGLL